MPDALHTLATYFTQPGKFHHTSKPHTPHRRAKNSTYPGHMYHTPRPHKPGPHKPHIQGTYSTHPSHPTSHTSDRPRSSIRTALCTCDTTQTWRPTHNSMCICWVLQLEFRLWRSICSAIWESCFTTVNQDVGLWILFYHCTSCSTTVKQDSQWKSRLETCIIC